MLCMCRCGALCDAPTLIMCWELKQKAYEIKRGEFLEFAIQVYIRFKVDKVIFKWFSLMIASHLSCFLLTLDYGLQKDRDHINHVWI